MCETTPAATTSPVAETTPAATTSPTVETAPAAETTAAAATVAELKLPTEIPQSIRDMFKVGKFTQEQADGALNMFKTQVTQIRQAEKADLVKKGQEHIKSWGEAASSNLALAKRALQVTDPTGALTKSLVNTGMNNSPVVLDYLLSVGKMLREGGFITSVAPPPGQKSAAQKRYPTMKE